jgi:hypothetical protein
MYNDMSVTLGDKRPFYSIGRNCVTRFRTGHLNIEDEDRSGRPPQVTFPDNVVAILSMILDNQRYVLKRQQRSWNYSKNE